MDAFNGLLSLAAGAWSLVMIVLLGLSDPKSRRTAQRPVRRVSSGLRLTAAILALLPGTLLLVAGSAVAFLIWFGFVTIAGWAIAIVLAPPARHRE
jgi:hypothetical protein